MLEDVGGQRGLWYKALKAKYGEEEERLKEGGKYEFV